MFVEVVPEKKNRDSERRFEVVRPFVPVVLSFQTRRIKRVRVCLALPHSGAHAVVVVAAGAHARVHKRVHMFDHVHAHVAVDYFPLNLRTQFVLRAVMYVFCLVHPDIETE